MKKILEKFGLINYAVLIKKWVQKKITWIRYITELKNNKPVVTIIGSCRQDSLYRDFTVTRIREELTYSHYIEEAIQVAEYCKDLNSPDIPHGAFRVDLLGKKRISRKALHRDFHRTDVFVVEIASLLKYFDGSYFYHHEAYDSPSSINENMSVIGQDTNIQCSKNSHEGVIAGLNKLFTLIPAEKTVLVSHIATKSGTDRSKLNLLVRQYAAQENIEYFDPSEILDIWPLSEICEIEPVISHFTKTGHEIVRDRLSQHIYKVVSNSRNNSNYVVHKYSANFSFIGFGDFIFGSIFLKKLASQKRLPIKFDLTGHPLGEFITEAAIGLNDSDVIEIYHNDSVNKFIGNGNYSSNRRPNSFDAGDIDFVLRNLFLKHHTLREKISQIFLRSHNETTVFHVRLGDDLAFKSNQNLILEEEYFDYVSNQIIKILENFAIKENHLVVSDSVRLKKYLSEKSIRTTDSHVVHFNSKEEANQNLTLNMLQEYLTLVGAKQIIQLSSYSWGSGFSESASMVGRNKITRIQLKSMS